MISALPPPVLPKFVPAFQPILQLLCSDGLLHILTTILTRTAATRSRSWSEAQLERVSGTGLDSNNDDNHLFEKHLTEHRILPRFREFPSFVSRFLRKKYGLPQENKSVKKKKKKNRIWVAFPNGAVLIPFDWVASGFLPEVLRGPESEARWRPLDPGLSSSFFPLASSML